MNILITGYTAMHVGRRDNLQSQFLTNNIDPLMENFKALGHNVTNRPVEPGEDLSVFDKIFVFIIEITSLNARYSGGTLYALRERPDAFMVIDDLKPTLETYRRQYLTKFKNKRIFRAKGWFHRDKILREDWEEYLIDACGIFSGKWPNPVILPSIIGGDLSNLGIPSDTYYQYDSSPWWEDTYNNIKFSYADKKKNWVLASLFPEKNSSLNKQEFNWPLISIGSKKGNGIGRIPEHEVIQYYADNWGLVFNTWKTKGCTEAGFWTYKYLTCKNFGNIPFGDPDEIGFIGPTWKWCAESPSEVERMNNTQLAELHRSIVTELDTKLWSKEQLRNFCVNILEK